MAAYGGNTAHHLDRRCGTETLQQFFNLLFSHILSWLLPNSVHILETLIRLLPTKPESDCNPQQCLVLQAQFSLVNG